ncbi:hypothetical protein JJB98_12125 [Bradyrhizobium diazoefficiens]|nr:hypothetical protein [Bradyrhizobium diazoefficiens]QQO20607.1 hypothetical protein JJB98_12125 [Bradyrhizobium diazoefficiens]
MAYKIVQMAERVSVNPLEEQSIFDLPRPKPTIWATARNRDFAAGKSLFSQWPPSSDSRKTNCRRAAQPDRRPVPGESDRGQSKFWPTAFPNINRACDVFFNLAQKEYHYQFRSMKNGSLPTYRAAT